MVPLPRALACSWGMGLLFPGEGEVLPAQRGWDGDLWGQVASGHGDLWGGSPALSPGGEQGLALSSHGWLGRS